jgi:hypothetical protein
MTGVAEAVDSRPSRGAGHVFSVKAGVALIALALTTSTQASGYEGEPLDLCHFSLRNADEFDELSVSASRLEGRRWTAHTPWNGDFGDAEFIDPNPAGPFEIREGKLRIIARKDKQGRWTSGLLAAADATGDGWGVQYGYFEARMKMPPGPGTWPAFWLMPLRPADDPSPNVEIDVVEYYGHDTGAFHSVWHVWFKPPNEHLKRDRQRTNPVPAGSLVKRFHDYGVLIEPDWITFYIDRMPVFRDHTPPELNSPMYPLVNLALGSGYPTKRTRNPAVLEVEYVRIYEPASAEARADCDKP